jgi:hypothetical protein
MVVFALFLGFFVAPVWALRSALQTADPLEESYGQHVLPFYSIAPGTLSFVVFADTSFGVGSQGPIHLFFFDSTCSFKRDFTVSLTPNDLKLLSLTDPQLLGVIPTQGVIFTDSGAFNVAATPTGALPGPSYLAYIILVNVTDNTLTRIDSIPFSRAQPVGPPAGLPGHWTRYDAFNTIAATFGDAQGAQPSGAIRTTLTFFNALGTVKAPLPAFAPPYNDLLAFLTAYGVPRVGGWVPTAAGITLIAYDGDENELGSAHISVPCFLRLRLGDPTLFPFLTTVGATISLGHIVASATPSLAPVCANNQCGFSLFQETVVESGQVDLIFSGYAHHSNGSQP